MYKTNELAFFLAGLCFLLLPGLGAATECELARTLYAESNALGERYVSFEECLPHYRECLQDVEGHLLEDKYQFAFAQYKVGQNQDALDTVAVLLEQLGPISETAWKSRLRVQALLLRSRIQITSSLNDVPEQVPQDLREAKELLQNIEDDEAKLELQYIESYYRRLAPDKEQAAEDAAGLLSDIVTGVAVDMTFGDAPPFWALDQVVYALLELQVLTPQLQRTPAVCLKPGEDDGPSLRCLQLARDLSQDSLNVALREWAERNYYYRLLDQNEVSSIEFGRALSYWLGVYNSSAEATAFSAARSVHDDYNRAGMLLSQVALWAMPEYYPVVQQELGIKSREGAADQVLEWLAEDTAIDPTILLNCKVLRASAFIQKAGLSTDDKERKHYLDEAWDELKDLPDSGSDVVRASLEFSHARIDTVYLVLIESLRGQYFELKAIGAAKNEHDDYRRWAEDAYRGVLTWFVGPKKSYLKSKAWLTAIVSHANRRLNQPANRAAATSAWATQSSILPVTIEFQSTRP